jgi:imidazole glycerol phosphate synthase glutamine amidotransferase subunit
VSAAREVLVVRTGTANLASVLAGLERAGAAPRLAASPDEVAGADRVVLPGVGAFGAALAELDASGLRSALVERVNDGRPTLCVCLGLQLLAAESEETPGAAGLGVLPLAVHRFPDSVRVPQLGWNSIEPDAGCALLAPGFVYFANSFALHDAPPGWSAAWAEHGGRFVAALERGPVLACQFHPELSGAFGRGLLERWLAAA